MSILKNITIKVTDSGFYLDGVFNGLTYNVGPSSSGVVRLYPIDVDQRAMLVDLETLTLTDPTDADVTPVDLQERAALLSSFVSKKKVEIEGQAVITVCEDTPLGLTGVTSRILGVFSDNGQNSLEFETLANGDVVYRGVSRKVMFVGSGTLSVSTPCSVTYRLFVNGSQLGNAETTLGFINANITGVITESSFITINNGDVFAVYADATKDNVVLTVCSLSILFKS